MLATGNSRLLLALACVNAARDVQGAYSFSSSFIFFFFKYEKQTFLTVGDRLAKGYEQSLYNLVYLSRFGETSNLCTYIYIYIFVYISMCLRVCV